MLNGITYGWLYTLSRINKTPYTYTTTTELKPSIDLPSSGAATDYLANASSSSSDESSSVETHFELQGGPSTKTMYLTALYYTMTCMTSVGFGNVAAETDNEKIFSICMMIVAGIFLILNYLLMKTYLHSTAKSTQCLM